MEKLRCLIADFPQLLLADIVQRLAEENEDVEVIGRVNEIEDLPYIIKKQAVDVLILGMNSNMLPQECNQILDETSNLLVVGLVDDGRRAAIYIDDVSKNEIAQIISTFGRKS